MTLTQAADALRAAVTKLDAAVYEERRIDRQHEACKHHVGQAQDEVAAARQALCEAAVRETGGG